MEKPWKNVPPTEISVYSPTHFVYPVSPRSIAFVASLCLTITFNLCPSTVYIEELIILKLAMEVWASKNYPRFQNGQRKRKIIISLILPRFSLNPRYICWAWLADKSEIGPMFSIVTFPLLNYFILGEKNWQKIVLHVFYVLPHTECDMDLDYKARWLFLGWFWLLLNQAVLLEAAGEVLKISLCLKPNHLWKIYRAQIREMLCSNTLRIFSYDFLSSARNNFEWNKSK